MAALLARIFHVFLSHAGQQKKAFVDCLRCILEHIQSGINVFMDEHSLVPGDPGWPTIVAAANSARIAVLVLSKEFVCKEAPMEELEIFIERFKAQGASGTDIVLIPVLWTLTYEQCVNLEEKVYKDWPRNEPSMPQQPVERRKKWAGLVKELLDITGIRADQAREYEGMLASRVAEVVVQRLKQLHLLPADHSDSVEVPWRVSTDIRLPAHEVVGREREVEAVLEGVRGPSRAAVLVGGPGEGKSTVAAVAALQLLQAGWFAGGALVVNFADYDGREPDGVKGFVAGRIHQQLLSLEGEFSRPQDATWAQMQRWLVQRSEGPVLLVLENTENVLQPGEPTKELMAVLAELQRLPARGCSACVRMIICSRRDLGFGLDGAPHVRIKSMPTEAAKQLLVSLASKEAKWEAGQPARLAEICGCNALAMEIIAGFIGAGRCTPGEAIADYEATGNLAEVGQVNNMPAFGIPLEVHGRVHLQWLERYLSREEQEAVARASVFAGSFTARGATAVGVPAAPIASASEQAAARWKSQLSQASFNRTASGRAAAGAMLEADELLSEHQAGVATMLRQLVHMSVLQEVAVAGPQGLQEGARRYQMHPLVRMLGKRLKVPELGDAPAGQSRSLELLYARWMMCDEAGPGQRMLHFLSPYDFDRVASEEHATISASMVHITAAEDANVREVARILCSWKWNGDVTRESHHVLQACLAVSTAYMHACFHTTEEILLCSVLFAWCARQRISTHAAPQADLLDATCCVLKQLMQTLQDTEKIEGILAPCVHRLSALVGRRGKVDVAGKLCQHLHTCQVRVLGESHRSTLTTATRLAQLRFGMGERTDLTSTLKHKEQVLQLQRQEHGEAHPDTIDAMAGLAFVMDLAGNNRGALELQQQALEHASRALGTESSVTIRIMDKLAKMLFWHGSLDRALELQTQVHEHWRKVRGETHPDTVDAVAALALIHYAQGDLSVAIQKQEWLVKHWSEAEGEKHFKTWSAKGHLASMVGVNGDWRRAFVLQEGVLVERSHSLGNNAPDILASKAMLARTAGACGERSRAEELVKQVLDQMPQVLALGGSFASDVLFNLARAYELMGDRARALELYEQALPLVSQAFGPSNPRTTEPMARLAALHCRHGNLSRSRELEQQVLQRWPDVHGEYKSVTVTAMSELAEAHRQAGNLSTARRLAQWVLDQRVILVGDGHRATIKAKELWKAICRQARWHRMQPWVRRGVGLLVCAVAVGGLRRVRCGKGRRSLQ